jgi:hypothetical protein
MDLTGKRLEILKEMLPKLSRVLIIYNPNNRMLWRPPRWLEAARQFGVRLSQATSVEGCVSALALKAKS